MSDDVMGITVAIGNGDPAILPDAAPEMTVEQLKEFYRAGHGHVGSAAIMDELDGLAAKVATLEADLGKAKLAAKAVPAPKAAKPRKLGPVADPMDRDATMAAIVAAETVEIAFSDGKQEIAGLPPFAIEGNAWRMSGIGVMLTTPLQLHGPAREQAPYSVGGYALILDGKLAAFSKRSDPIVMAAGSTFDLTNEVFFG